MSNVCEICGKGKIFGHKGIHKHSGLWRNRAPLKLASWKPNLRRIRLSINGQNRRIKICTDCLKSTKMVAAQTAAVRQTVSKPEAEAQIQA